MTYVALNKSEPQRGSFRKLKIEGGEKLTQHFELFIEQQKL